MIELTVAKAAVTLRPREPSRRCEFGVLPIDSIHTPIKNVKYWVENCVSRKPTTKN